MMKIVLHLQIHTSVCVCLCVSQYAESGTSLASRAGLMVDHINEVLQASPKYLPQEIPNVQKHNEQGQVWAS